MAGIDSYPVPTAPTAPIPFMSEYLSIFDYLFFGAGLFSTALQIGCIIHVIRSGRDYYWLLLILFLPVMGSLIYIVSEVLPGFKNSRLIRSFGHSKKAGMSTIRKLKEQVEFTDTVSNRIELADAYLSRNQFQQAYDLFSGCREGIYENDAAILHKLADAAYGIGKYEETVELLIQVQKSNYRDYRHERDYLLAEAYAKTGKMNSAIGILERLVDVYPGERARYRLGVLYEESGRPDDAVRVFEAVIRNRKLYKGAAVGSQAKWVSQARRHLKGLKRVP